MSADNLARYVRQTIFPGVGVEGQRRLLSAKAVVVGCGALDIVDDLVGKLLNFGHEYLDGGMQ